jgi:fructose-1,6-bisphosphatase I/sedoheptulose-1,7-bisphosphatase
VAADRKTLGQFLEEAQFPETCPAAALRTLLLDLSSACKTIGRRVSDEPMRASGGLQSAERGGWMAHLRSRVGGRGLNACSLRRGHYRAVLVPVDSPSNIEMNLAGGTIFSVLQMQGARKDAATVDIGRRCRQVCSGYAIHGPSLVLVLALDAGVHAFALDRTKDEFILTHVDIHIPATTDEIAVDISDTRFWQPAIRRYVDECLAGDAGSRGRNFRIHWLGSMVAEAHRILMRGGVFVRPATGRSADRAEQPRFLQEANPLAFVIERAGGRASTGTARLLDVAPTVARSRTPLIFGAAEEVERIEAYHRDPEMGRYDAPLFAERGLFRSTA